MTTPTLPHLTATATQHPDSCLSLSQPLLHFLHSTIQAHKSTRILSIGSGSGLLETLLQESFLSDNSTELPSESSTTPLPSNSNNSDPPITIHGIEPHPGLANKYLPRGSLHLVAGTWAVYEDALAYDVWLFVYPRDTRLVCRYLDLLLGKHEKFRYENEGEDEGEAKNLASACASDSDTATAAATAAAASGIDLDAAKDRQPGWTIIWVGPRTDWIDFSTCFQRDGIVLESLWPGPSAGVAEWELVCVFRCSESWR